MIYEDIAIQILFSILFLCSTGNDDESSNTENGFVPSFATNNSIVRDVIEGFKGQYKLQKSITYSFESCPYYSNTSKQCFPSLRNNDSSFELYNVTDQAEQWKLIAKRGSLRFYAETSAETSSDVNQTIGSKAKAFIKESINYIHELDKNQRTFILLTYIYAICKYCGLRVRRIISKIYSKLFGKRTRAIPRKFKNSLSKRGNDNLPTTPSEKTILVQNEIACNDQVNTINEVTSTKNDLSCACHVNSDEGTKTRNNAAHDSHENSDHETTSKNNIPCKSNVDTDDESTTCSLEDLPTVIHKSSSLATTYHTSPPSNTFIPVGTFSPYDESCADEFPDEYLPTAIHQSSSLTTIYQSSPPPNTFIPIGTCSSYDQSCTDEFPDEFFLLSSDCGNVGLILGTDEWEKIETEDTCQEVLTTEDGGTFSTGMRSGQDYDVAGDGDSRVSSPSYRHSPVPMEMVYCLSCASDDGDSSDDGMEESGRGNMQYDNHVPLNIDIGRKQSSRTASCDYAELLEETLDCGDTQSSIYTNTVNIEDYDMFIGGHDELIIDLDSNFDISWQAITGECPTHDSSLVQSDYNSDVIIVDNDVEPERAVDRDGNRWVAIDIEEEDEILQENDETLQEDQDEILQDEMVITLEQRVKNHAVAAAIFTGTFILPCFIAAKLLK